MRERQHWADKVGPGYIQPEYQAQEWDCLENQLSYLLSTFNMVEMGVRNTKMSCFMFFVFVF